MSPAIHRIIIGAIAIAVSAIRADACYTGLTIIPTAEVLDHGEYGIEQQFDGTFPLGGSGTQTLDTEFGILPRWEAGIDFDLTDECESGLLLNAKCLICPCGKHRPALAIGLCNAGAGVASSPYLVATKDFGGPRAHLGVVRTDGRNRWFVGADFAVNDRLTLMADYVSGSENSSSAGISYQFDDRFGILAGMMLPNGRGQDTGFTLHLVLNGPFSTTGGGK
jgi:hypothetical protein